MADEPDNQELTQADLDAALAGAADQQTDQPAQAAESSAESAGALDAGDIEAALAGADATTTGEQPPAEQSQQQTGQPDAGEPETAPTLAGDEAADSPSIAAQDPADTGSPDLPNFAVPPDAHVSPEDVAGEIGLLNDVDLNVKIELGRTRMLVQDVLRLGDGSVVELDKAAGDPVDVYVNERLVARGEVLVLNDNFCVRVCEIISDIDGQEFAQPVSN